MTKTSAFLLISSVILLSVGSTLSHALLPRAALPDPYPKHGADDVFETPGFPDDNRHDGTGTAAAPTPTVDDHPGQHNQGGEHTTSLTNTPDNTNHDLNDDNHNNNHGGVNNSSRRHDDSTTHTGTVTTTAAAGSTTTHSGQGADDTTSRGNDSTTTVVSSGTAPGTTGTATTTRGRGADDPLQTPTSNAAAASSSVDALNSTNSARGMKAGGALLTALMAVGFGTIMA